MINRTVIVLAFLGAVFVGFVTSLFVPNTPLGQMVAFLAFGAAMYPVARAVWLANLASWKYWLGLAIGAGVGWTIDTWRRTALSDSSNHDAGLIVVGLLTAAIIVGTIARSRSTKRRTDPRS